MKKATGRFSSFADMGAAMGITPTPSKRTKGPKCPKCGGEMFHIDGTNVYVCDFYKLAEDKLADGTEVYVASKCEQEAVYV